MFCSSERFPCIVFHPFFEHARTGECMHKFSYGIIKSPSSPFGWTAKVAVVRRATCSSHSHVGRKTRVPTEEALKVCLKSQDNANVGHDAEQLFFQAMALKFPGIQLCSFTTRLSASPCIYSYASPPASLCTSHSHSVVAHGGKRFPPRTHIHILTSHTQGAERRRLDECTGFRYDRELRVGSINTLGF